jgi:ERCC4-type nuclease
VILIDGRVGSGELAAPLLAMGLPVETVTLEFGDIAFSGSGPDGTTVQIAVERKKLSDLLGSFASGRLTGHQVPGLTEGFDAVWLLVEGRYRSGPDGILEWGNEREWKDAKSITQWGDAGYGARRWTYREIEHRLTTLELRAGLRVVRTSDEKETVAWIGALYNWWRNETWEGHTSHVPAAMKATLDGRSVRLLPPSMKERIAAQLPHLGSTKASMAAGHFTSVLEMITAEPEAWSTMPGIGKKSAKDIVASIRGL